MPREALRTLFDDYAAYHRHPINKLCHYIGIPLIVFTLVGLLLRLSPLPALLVAGLAIAYQVRLSPYLTFLFALFVAASFLLAPYVGTDVLWAGFVLGWVLQFVGHYAFERKSPAFFKNLQQLLVGPLWILGTLGAMPSSRPEALDTAPPESPSRTR